MDPHTWPRKTGRPARTYIQQLCEDTGCCPEDLPRAMNDREEWRERVRDIRATSTIWWWWWWCSSNGACNTFVWWDNSINRAKKLIIVFPYLVGDFINVFLFLSLFFSSLLLLSLVRGKSSQFHLFKNQLLLFTNPSARAGYDTRSIFKRSLTGFEFRVFLLLD